MDYSEEPNGSNPVLGYGHISAGDSLADLDAAVRLVVPGAWARIYLSSPAGWKASPLIQSAQVKRVSEDQIAYDWLHDGGDLGPRREVVSGLLRLAKSTPVAWEVDSVPMPWTGTSPVATEPPFGWELPKPALPGLPEVKLDIPWVPLGIGLGALLILFGGRR